MGCLVLGFGVFMDVVMLPGECTVKAISSTWSTDFGKTKVAVDVTMSVTAAGGGLILYRALTGVREGHLHFRPVGGIYRRAISEWDRISRTC